MLAKRHLIRLVEGFITVKSLIHRVLDATLFVSSSIGLLFIIAQAGFYLTPAQDTFIYVFLEVLTFLFLGSFFIRFLLMTVHNPKKRLLLLEFFLLFLVILIALSKYLVPHWIEQNLPWLHFFSSYVLQYLLIGIVWVIEVLKQTAWIFSRKSNPARLFLYSFLLLIFGGAGLLMLPKASNGIGFVDALFTSTSAVCVTGLSTVDIVTVLTPQGKFILLALIQLGGLGVMTFTSFFGLMFSGNLSFSNNVVLKDILSTDSINDISKSLMKIILITFLIEVIGALFMFYSLDSSVFPDVGHRFRISVFHSISAFCNAGFSTVPGGLTHSALTTNYFFILIISFLIIFGGIGFPILFNFYKYIKHKISGFYYRLAFGIHQRPSPYLIHVNSRIVITATIILLVGGTVAFYFLERNNSFQDHSEFGKWVTAFFHSVTPRTAGFNTLDYAVMMPTTILLTIFLMWVGASPSSTGGGIKTTSFAIAVLKVFSISRGKSRIEVYKREISEDSVQKVFVNIFLSLIVIGFAIILLTAFEPGKGLDRLAFECFSAFGTVGLSMNLTPELSDASKITLSIVMYLGRVGTLTIFVAVIRKIRTTNYMYPKENIIIG